MRVSLGNAAAIEAPEGFGSADGERQTTAIPGEQVTQMIAPEGMSLGDFFDEIRNAWKLHSTEPPAWIESDNEALATLLSSHFGDVQIGRPSDWPTDEREPIEEGDEA